LSSDFREFARLEPVTPPAGLTSRIQSVVEKDLNPSPWKTFGLLAGIHFFMGLLTLSFCPQFGIRIAGSGMGLMEYFMGFGDIGCGACCGVIFLGGSLLIASLILSPDQVRTIRKYRWLEVGALCLLSLGLFIMLQREIVLGFALAWLAGSFMGGLMTLEAGWRLSSATRRSQ
jgi:hypothetical protein